MKLTLVLVPAVVIASVACGTVTPDEAGVDAAPDDGDKLDFSDLSWDFGGIPLGSASAAFTTRITNGGETPVGPLTMETTGDDADDFAVDATECVGRTLGRGSDCTITITFRPMQAGARAAALTVRGAEGSTASLALLGRGVRASALVLEPAELTFGALTIGTLSSPKTLTLTNTGDAALTPSLRVSNDHYQLLATTCDGPLQLRESCEISVGFQPPRGGPQPGSVSAIAGDIEAVATTSGTGTATLRVSKLGDGAIRGTGIDCGSDCTETVSTATVTLTAAPTSPSDLGGWSIAGCARSTTCDVAINAATVDATATFRYRLTVTSNRSNATVRSTVPDTAIQCGSSCQGFYAPGTSVQLQATASAGSYFSSWDGCPMPAGDVCTIPLNGHATVNANFRLRK